MFSWQAIGRYQSTAAPFTGLYPAFLPRMADGVGASRAAPDTRAVLRTLDLILPEVLTAQLHAELKSIWAFGARQITVGWPLATTACRRLAPREPDPGPPGTASRILGSGGGLLPCVELSHSVSEVVCGLHG